MICEQIQQEEKELLQDIEEFLNMDDYSKQCKKEMLYSKWSQQVFSPLHTSLLSVMESPAIKYTDVQRRNLFDRYITLKNNKDVFLNTINITEYNPMRLHYISTKAQVPKLRDPLLLQEKLHQEELEILNEDGKAIETTPIGREDTDAVLWLAMELTEINSNIRFRSRQKVHDKQTRSYISNGTVVDEGSVMEEPALPHKTPICYPREEMSLKWEEQTVHVT
jgi:hypothetical protein